MTSPSTKPTTVDEYIARFDPAVQKILNKVRATVREAVPNASEVISYGMPALKQHGVLVYFAAFKAHIGLYPPITGNAGLEKSASVYAGEKGNLRFPYSSSIPYELIGALAKLRAEQDAEKYASRRKLSMKTRAKQAVKPKSIVLSRT